MAKISEVKFKNYTESVKEALDLIGASSIIAQQNKIIIKPNLVTDKPPPCTTDVRCVEAIVKYCKIYSPNANIIIAEGSGGCNTNLAFSSLGYMELAQRYNLKLIDVDSEKEIITLENPKAKVLKKLHIPKVLTSGFLISVPVLKDHSLQKTTLSLKNLIGFMPAKYYAGFWSYKKSQVHNMDTDRAIVDLNLYFNIRLCVIDGVIGQKGCHLSGRRCFPPKNVILAGFDPVAVDITGSKILGWNWEDITYLKYAKSTLFI
jgi:uncharacterized protein (DUF362 family)